MDLNLQALKYALEVERNASISKAAEKLYMGQPNLSKAIKELESTLGIAIFKRTPKGVVPTRDGEKFLAYARKILGEIEEMKVSFWHDKNSKVYFDVVVPKTSYISNTFAEFVSRFDNAEKIEMNFKETDSMQVIRDVSDEDYNLGVVRYKTVFEKYYIDSIKEKGLVFEPIYEFDCIILMSKNHPLADKDDLTTEDLAGYVEVAHGDWAVPRFSQDELRKHEKERRVAKRIYIYERGSQFDMLRKIPSSYMLATPLPNNDLLTAHGLLKKRCKLPHSRYKDLLVYRKGYKLTEIELLFIDKLKGSITEMNKSDI